MRDFNAEDWDIEITEDGVIEGSTIPGHEPEEDMLIQHVVSGYSLGVIVVEDDRAYSIEFHTTRGQSISFVLEPRTIRSLAVALIGTIERELT